MDSINRLVSIVTFVHEKIIKMIGPQKPELSTVGKRLLGLSNDMETIIADAEPDFLHLGNELQSIFSTATKLSNLVIQGGRASSNDSEEKILKQISGLAKGSVDRLKECRNEIAESLTILDSGKNDLEKLAKLCSKQEQISMLLNVIALNIAVESNRTRQSSEMFVVFAQEIKQVAANMKNIAQNLYEDSGATCRRQEKVQTEIAGRFNQLSAVTTDAETVVAEAVAKIDQLAVLFENTMQNGIRYSKEISDQVAEIVMAIQFHDIVRQQIEHVAQALQDTETFCPDEDADADTQNGAGKMYALLEIQAAQIRQVIIEIEKAENRISLSFENIESKASRLVACLSESFVTQGNAEAHADNPFVILIQSLEELSQLMNQAYDLQSRMNRAATEASSSIDGLAGHTKKVQDISLDLHRKALNAIIKSAHLGEMGATFEILAQEVTTVSQESNLFADQIIMIIDSVSSLAAKLGRSGRNMVTEGTRVSNPPEFQLDEEAAKVKDTYRLFLENTSHASETSRLLETSIRETRAFLSFLKNLVDRLTLPLQELESIMQDLAPWKELDQNLTTDIPDAARRYTMESERIIHSQIIGRTHQPDGPASDQPSDETPVEFFSDDDESQNSIALFDEQAPDAEPVELFETDTADDDDVELFEDESTDSDTDNLVETAEKSSAPIIFFEKTHEPPVPEKNKPDDPEHNDNIELF